MLRRTTAKTSQLLLRLAALRLTKPFIGYNLATVKMPRGGCPQMDCWQSPARDPQNQKNEAPNVVAEGLTGAQVAESKHLNLVIGKGLSQTGRRRMCRIHPDLRDLWHTEHLPSPRPLPPGSLGAVVTGQTAIQPDPPARPPRMGLFNKRAKNNNPD